MLLILQPPFTWSQVALKWNIRASLSVYESTQNLRFLSVSLSSYENLKSLKPRRALVFRKDVVVIDVRGWAFDRQNSSAITSIESEDNSSSRLKVGRLRPDVAAALGVVTAKRCGFWVRYLLDDIPAHISLVMVDNGSAKQIPTSKSVVNYYQGIVSLTEETGREFDSHTVAFVDEISISRRSRFQIPRFARRAFSGSDFSVRELASVAVLEDPDILRSTDLGDFETIYPDVDRLKKNRLLLELFGSAAQVPGFSTLSWRLATNPSSFGTSSVVLPRRIDKHGRVGGAPATKRVRVPIPGVRHFTHCKVVHKHLIVDHSDTLVVDEFGARPPLDFVAGEWDLVVGSPLRYPLCLVKKHGPVSHCLPSAILLPFRVPQNYFHSLVEGAARSIHLLGEEFHGVPVLVPAELPNAVVDAVCRVLGEDRFIRLGPEDVVSVDELLVPSSHTIYHDSTVESWWRGAGVDWPTIDGFRHRLLDSAKLTSTPDRVFIVRSMDSIRGLRNQDQIKSIARDFDFEVVSPGELDLDEQISIFSNAKVIVGAGGAAMANLIFAKEGLKVLGLVSHHLHDFAMFSTLAAHAGAEYFTLTGPSDRHLGQTEFHRDVFHGDFWISPRAFRSALRFLCQ